MSFFEGTLKALNESGARYIVVGGLAVNLHGHVRVTIDLDLVIDLSPDQALSALDALTAIGFRPAVPVEARAFADTETRESWIREKHMLVFPLRDPDDLTRRVDVFVREPIPFEEMWARSVVLPYKGTTARVASVEDLITMKREAGRPQDIADIEALEEIRGDGNER